MDQPKTFKEGVKGLFVKNKMDVPPVVDRQTNKSYEVLSEAIWDIAAATISVLYLFAMLVLFSWALFDVYHGQNQVLALIFSEDTTFPDSPLARMIAYAVIGGGLGGVVNGFRSIVNWHCEHKAFGWRFLWKYVTLPPLGAIVAGIVYAIVNGGIGVLGGSFTTGAGSANQALSAFGIGALAGYASHTVYKWLDSIADRVFSTVKAEVEVPAVTDKTREEAKATLEASGLKSGKVEDVIDPDDKKNGKVISQDPTAGKKLPKGSPVDIKVAKKNA